MRLCNTDFVVSLLDFSFARRPTYAKDAWCKVSQRQTQRQLHGHYRGPYHPKISPSSGLRGREKLKSGAARDGHGRAGSSQSIPILIQRISGTELEGGQFQHVNSTRNSK